MKAVQALLLKAVQECTIPFVLTFLGQRGPRRRWLETFLPTANFIVAPRGQCGPAAVGNAPRYPFRATRRTKYDLCCARNAHTIKVFFVS